MLNLQKLHEDVAHAWQAAILPSLIEYISIPCKSPHFDEKWQENGYIDEAVAHVAAWCKAHAPAGMTLEVLRLPGRTPLLLIDVPGVGEETILLYGHLDKQPEMSGWREGMGPWTPVIEKDRLYGRGAADDGYAVYASLTALNALQEQGVPHPRCILIIETCEESGSYDLPYYIATIKDRIGEPSLVICLDSGAGNYEQLWITTSLRGTVTAELTVELLKEGVHSGYASGIVSDSFRIAKQLISRIEDEMTGEIKLAALYCDISEERAEQAAFCATVLDKGLYRDLPLHDNVLPVHHDSTELILNRTWRPALTITGASGLPELADAGNVLRPKTALKLSMRIPPLVSPEKAALAIENALMETPPYQAKIACRIVDAAPGWDAPPVADWLAKAVNDASLAFYQKPAVYIGEGGTIPFMGMLGEKFPEAQFMITGVLGPHSNAHGPNEFLDLKMVEKLSCCVAYVIAQALDCKKSQNPI